MRSVSTATLHDVLGEAFAVSNGNQEADVTTTAAFWLDSSAVCPLVPLAGEDDLG